jgi:hypothetical protein
MVVPELGQTELLKAFPSENIGCLLSPSIPDTEFICYGNNEMGTGQDVPEYVQGRKGLQIKDGEGGKTEETAHIRSPSVPRKQRLDFLRASAGPGYYLKQVFP